MTKKEKFIVYSDVPHTHTPHTRHTHTHHIHTTDKRITYTSHTRTLYHTNITHVQVFQLISFNSIHSTHLTLVSHVMQVLTCLWLTARLATWRASSISWRVSLFGGYDDLWGSWTAAGKSEPIQSELPGPKGTAPWQSCTMWAKVSIPGFPDDYWQQRGVGHANLGWNPGMFFGWFPVSSLKVGECWAAASTTGSRWRRRLRALCQQHVCGWLHPATIDMFSLAYTYPSLQLLGLSWFPPQWDSTSAWHRGGSMAVAAEAGVFALAALGQLPSGAEALHFSVRVEAAEDRSCSFETHWGPGTKPYTCALPTPPVIDLQNCEMEYDFNAVVRLGHIKVHSDVPMAVVEELRADFSELDYNCFNKNCLTYAMELLEKASSRALSKDIFWGSRFRTWFESCCLQLAWATRSSQQQQA